MEDTKSMTEKKLTCFAGHFDGHADQAVWCRRSRATLDATGCRHSPRISPAEAMVIDFGVKNQVVAL
jgi:hypothetical protein